MLTIARFYNSDCTLGRLVLGSFQCFTLELPWLNNANDISCIPEGFYKAFKRNSPTNGFVIELKDVPNRSYVQIHKGNYTRNVKGCILVGDGIKFLDSDSIPDVTSSSVTLTKLLSLLPEEFEVTIKGSDKLCH
jgi:hypothetical protein